MDSLELIVFIIVVVMVALLIKGMRNGKQSNTTQQQATTQTAGPTTIVDGNKQQIVDDIRATQTSRVVDQVAILEDLGQTTQNYRQFCELAGVTQTTGGVTAPYSKRQVAYYDVRCYKIERVNGREIETLVAQERSFDRFYFTDASCDTKVYVALDTFGKNVILVNSMNHIEGPTSDFSKAISNRTASISGTSAAKLMVADAARGLRTGLRNAWSWTVLAPGRVGSAASSAFGFAGSRMQPAYAGATGSPWQLGNAGLPNKDGYVFFSDDDRRPKPSKGRKPSSQHPIGGGRPQQHSSQSGFGGSKPPHYSSQVTLGSGKIPSGLDSFLGLGGAGMGGLQQNPYLGGPMSPSYGGYGAGKTGDLGTALLNIGLSALLASMNTSSSGGNTHTSYGAPHTSNPTHTTAPVSSYTQTNNTFMGYRIVEDVVPLNYPVYCIGDLYKNGSEVYMGKAMGKVSQSYYFATKLEAEVLEHLQK